MSPVQIGWVDFTKEDRDKVLSVIDLLSEPGAVDALGVGILRDRFADLLFPGTSTIQTRAKYFLLIPYIMKELEQEAWDDGQTLIGALHEKELDLIDVLKSSADHGVIGANSGRKLKRKPSSIYWNGLRTFGIFRYEHLTLNDYASLVTNERDEAEKTSFWRLPLYTDKWRKDLQMMLTQAEANFLRDRVIESCPETLFEKILSEKLTTFSNLASFDDLLVYSDLLSDRMLTDLHYAISFRHFVHGLHMRYNYLLSSGKEEAISVGWDKWFQRWSTQEKVPLEEIFMRTRFHDRESTRFFLVAREKLELKDLEGLDALLIKRERRLKGDARAKLLYTKEIPYEGWVGLGMLDYRMRTVQQLTKDIFEGLGDKA